MVGDVNLFVLDAPEDEPADNFDVAAVRCAALQPAASNLAQREAGVSPSCSGPPRKVQLEVMVMVAEAQFRRCGLARAAVQRVMVFALVSAELRQRLNVTSFVAKISTKNAPSIALFKSLGYVVTAEVGAFEEVHLTWWPLGPAPSGSGSNLDALRSASQAAFAAE